MFSEFAPILTLPLTIVTERLVVTGTIQTRRRRLSDFLNEPDLEHLVLTDASFAEHESGRVLARGQVAQVKLGAVLLVYTTEATESGAEERTLKQPILATMLVPPFTVEGLIHLPLEDSLKGALDEYGGRFVAVTKGSYWANDRPDERHEAELIVVNHAHLHVCIGDDVEWRPASGLEQAGAGGW